MFLKFFVFLFLLFLIGCEDPLDPQDSFISASQNGVAPQPETASLNQAPLANQLAQSRHISGPFFTPTIFDSAPTQYVSCTKGSFEFSDIVTVSLYFHDPDEDEMRCSLISYSRIYRGPEKFSETWSRLRAPEQTSCWNPAQEAISSREENGLGVQGPEDISTEAEKRVKSFSV